MGDERVCSHYMCDALLLTHLYRPLIERYKTCKDADEMVAMQEAIQAEIQQEALDRRDAQHEGDANDMLFENPNHSASAWRPLQRSKKQLREQNLALTDEDEGVEVDGANGQEGAENSDEESEERDSGEDENNEEGDEEDESDDEAAQIAAGRIRKTDKLGNDYWVDAGDAEVDEVSTVTTALDKVQVSQ